MSKLSSQVKMMFLFSAIILILSSIALACSSIILLASDKIFYGIKVENVPVGGLSVEEAANKLEKHYNKQLNDQPLIQLNNKDQRFNVKAADINFQIDFQATAQEAFNIGRSANLIENIYARIAASHKGTAIHFQTHFDETKLNNYLGTIAKQTISPKQNARLEVNQQAVNIIPEVEGRSLDTDELKNKLTTDILHLQLPVKMELPLKVDTPSVTAADLQGIDTVLAVYSSTFNAANVNRSENIRIAAASINNLLLKPQEIISFNKIVGPRIVEAGFKEAPVIVEGKTVPDIGGGVCQVSSTLYNAILLADMAPVERTPHFHPLGYVPIGLDATVADNLLDFKFKNSLTRAAYIMTTIQNGVVTVTVLGHKEDLSTYKINIVSHIDKILEPQVVIQYDDTLPAGKRVISEEGMKGYIVSSYRVKTSNGQEISRQLLYTDEYTPEDQIIIFGTMLPADDGKPKK